MIKKDLLILNNISQEKLNSLSSKKIYFGHQSVGFNILDGIKDIIQEMPQIKLNIKETIIPVDFKTPIFGHSRVGKNQDPISKIDEFKKNIEAGIGDKVDIAFFKFCYIDIRENSDVEYIFKYYVDTMAYLQNKYTNVKFFHISVPLIATPGGIKTTIKRMIGRSVWTDAGNIKRYIFNQLLLNKYRDSVFDLADYESTFLDGRKEYFVDNNKKIYSLVRAYASDEGHLNIIGQRIIGSKLLLFLITR